MSGSKGLFVFCIAVLAVVAGCSTTPNTTEKRDDLHERVMQAIAGAKNDDPGISKFFDGADGYAIFPTVGKGAIGVGGAYGRGELYEKGMMIGYCDLSQASIGFQLGGQAYTEIIFFETPGALSKFKSGNFAFAAQASAVAVKSGASANAKYADGVAVFTRGEQGLMYEASIGGQKFSYEAK